MSELIFAQLLPANFDRKSFVIYMTALLVLSLLGLSFLLYKGKYLFVGLILSLPVLLYVVTQPKIAIGQYVILLFVSRTVVESIPLTVTDIAGLIVVTAGILDFLLNDKRDSILPKLSLNFLLLILALCVSGLFAYDQGLAMRAIARVILLFCVFWSLHRLIKNTGTSYPVKFFFWLCVVNSVWVISTFVYYGGAMRFFGFATKFFDDLTMLLFPLGIALYLWSEKGRGGKYLIGSLIILAALVSTQSRAPLMISLASAALIFLISYLRKNKERIKYSNSNTVVPIIGRAGVMIIVVAGAATTAVLAKPELFETVFLRFQDILSIDVSGAIWKRVVLWRNAFDAFVNNPIVGIGPGNYKIIHTIYPVVQLDFIQFFVRGLNAHNLVLHYMAETGLVGTIPMLLLMLNQFRISRRGWISSKSLKELQLSSALYAIGLVLLITSLLEADWLWGFAGYTFVFCVALISRNSSRLERELI